MQPDPEVIDDGFTNNVCLQCESKANRTFWIAVFVFLGMAFLIALPSIVVSGGDSHATTAI